MISLLDVKGYKQDLYGMAADENSQSIDVKIIEMAEKINEIAILLNDSLRKSKNVEI